MGLTFIRLLALLLNLNLIAMLLAMSQGTAAHLRSTGTMILVVSFLLTISPWAVLLVVAGRKPGASIPRELRVAGAASGVWLAFVGVFALWSAAVDSSVTTVAVGLCFGALGTWGLVTSRRLPPPVTDRARTPRFGYVAPPAAGLLAIGVVALDGSRLIPSWEYGSIEKAHVAAMRSDLRALHSAQEAIRQERGTYAEDIDTFFSASTGVIGPRIAVTPDGWTASVSHSGTAVTCAMFVGSTPIGSATTPNEPACTGDIRRRPDYGLFDYALVGGALAITLVAASATVRARR